jgi:Predicted nucleotide-binding protein containing TIR-like domain/Clp amino terminal domain, pathogenicity island component
MSERMTAEADQVLATAAALALQNAHDAISTGHLLLAIASAAPGSAADVLRKLGVTAEGIYVRLIARKTAVAKVSDGAAPRFTDAAGLAVQSAKRQAANSGVGPAGPEHLLLALMSGPINTAVHIIHDLNSTEGQVRTKTIERMAAAKPFTAARNVFVVHGRDEPARMAMFGFLTAIHLFPLEWEHIVRLADHGSPVIGDAIDIGFDHVRATIVLMTPDDFGQLHPDLHEPGDGAAETSLCGQPRANVLYEAGMAMAKMPLRTTFVEIGGLRPFTNIAGRSVVRMIEDPVDTHIKLKKIVGRLKTAGCPVDDSGTDWLRADRFTSLRAHRRSVRL